MTYLLDTNVCIRYLNETESPIRSRMEGLSPDDVAVCSVVKAELFYGASKSQSPEETRAKLMEFFGGMTSLTFDDAAAETCGEIRASLAKQGTPIGPYDVQIAGIALAHGLTLVSHNTREFSRVPGLRIDDWEGSP